MNTNQLIEALLEPESYPHPVDVITTIETHISIVFLTGQYAYKLKKPVDFGFLDFSTLENRKKYCQLELQLNRRTAPDLYLDVIQITSSKQGIELLTLKETSQTDEAVDYLVKMKQFNPNDVLGRKLQQDKLSFEMSEMLAKQISSFHEIAEPVSLSETLGDPEVQLQPMLDNFPTLYKAFTNESTTNRLDQLKDWTNQTFKALKPRLIERKQQGFVRACHGDLHLDNIALIDGKPLLFDGIEFNDHFRWIDVISDLAFLLIDLEFRKQQAASCQVLSLYLSKTLDFNALKSLNFYRVYRTLVRAKITSLRAEQLPDGSLEKQHVVQTAHNYIDQAYQYIQKNQTPQCILMQGVSGSGKSYLANQILENLDYKAVVISSDRIRKSLYGIDSVARVSKAETQQLYSPEMNQKTYDALADYSAICLQLGFNVIVDATFLRLEHRQRIYKVAGDHHAHPLLISINTTQETASKAIEMRQFQANNPSDADQQVMLKQLNAIEAPAEFEEPLILQADELRKHFPKQQLQEFLDLPIT